jgi:hypothetical protein
MSDLYSLLKERDRIFQAGPSSFPPGIYEEQLEEIQKQINLQAGKDADFEKVNKRLREAARVLKPFVEGHPTKADYARIEEKGLPPVSDAVSIYSMPDPSMWRMRAVSNEEAEHTSRMQKAHSRKFRKLALLYGWAGQLAVTLNRDKQAMSQVLLHALGQDAPEPDEIARRQQVTMRVVSDGPPALKALDWSITLHSVREKLARLLDRGVPVTRDALPEAYRKNKEILGEIALCKLWYWCPHEYQGSRGHWYAADRRRQKACARHQRAGRQARWRRRAKKPTHRRRAQKRVVARPSQ